MKTPKNLKKTFNAYVRINVEVGVKIAADSLEDAIAQAQKYDVTDVIDLGGHDYNDGAILVTGAFEERDSVQAGLTS